MSSLQAHIEYVLIDPEDLNVGFSPGARLESWGLYSVSDFGSILDSLMNSQERGERGNINLHFSLGPRSARLAWVATMGGTIAPFQSKQASGNWKQQYAKSSTFSHHHSYHKVPIQAKLQFKIINNYLSIIKNCVRSKL